MWSCLSSVPDWGKALHWLPALYKKQEAWALFCHVLAKSCLAGPWRQQGEGKTVEAAGKLWDQGIGQTGRGWREAQGRREGVISPGCCVLMEHTPQAMHFAYGTSPPKDSPPSSAGRTPGHGLSQDSEDQG